MGMKRQLNLGCGRFPRTDHLNVDLSPLAKADLRCDLERPLPFADGTFSRVTADHVLEHLGSPFRVMAEIHRVLAPGGFLILRVPHFSRGFSHPEHQRGFDVSFPLYFDRNFQGGFTGTEFRLEGMRLTWFGQEELKKTVLAPVPFLLGAWLGFFLDRLAALSPYFCSRVWCFLVGGFDEIEFRFQKAAEG